jgi:glycerophosphoryl diester phosphodiesterase
VNGWRWAIAAVGTFAALGVLYWFAIGGFARPHPSSWLTAQPFAHRGDHFEVLHPENSLLAFRSAVEAGRGVELDVHLSSDGQLVVIHDDTLLRTTGDPRPVSAVPFAELRTLRLEGTAEQIPTLSEVLDVVGGRVPVLVEIKNNGTAGPLEDAVVRELRAYRGQVAVTSFDPLSLGHVAKIAPEIPRGQISGLFSNSALPSYQLFVLQHLMLNFWSRPDFIVYEAAAVPSWDTSMQRAFGRKLVVYAPATLPDAQRAAQDADNFIGEPGAFVRR